MRVATQAFPFVIALGLLAAISGWLLGFWYSSPFLLLILFVLYFFRDPERIPPAGDGLVLSPADGRVMEIDRSPDGDRISIFLSIFNCHINRAPVGGTVREVRYSAGRFQPAWRGTASSQNERNHLVIATPAGEYGVTQIAGLIARRIVCGKRPGDVVHRGERIGMIRFGSRTDLHLPSGALVTVSVGDHVYGGLSVVGRDAQAEARVAAGGAQ